MSGPFGGRAAISGAAQSDVGRRLGRDPLELTLDACLAENPRWSVPVLEFQGTPTGIDVTKVCRTGILPQINTGMAGKVAGVGQVGAGLVTPPAEIFPKALRRLAELADH